MMRSRISVLQVCFLPALYFLSATAFAQSHFIPRVELNEQYIENDTASENETGYVTRLSPGFQYTTKSSRSSISIDYSLDMITSSGLSQDDEVNHNLNMRDTFTHIPGRWVTEITGNIRQANISSDGIQLLNANLSSDNTSELRTLGVNTDFNGRMAEYVWFKTVFGTDYSEYKDGESSNGYKGYFSIDNTRAHKVFSWQIDVNRSVSESKIDDQTIDTTHLNLDYRINQKISTFLDAKNVQTDNSNLDENVSLLGINWTPGRNTSIRIAAGKRGDENTYLLNSSHKSRKTTISASYEETITSSRENTIAQQSSGSVFSGTTDSLSIVPVLQKSSSVDVMLEGRRSKLGITLFQTDRDRRDTTPLERINGVKLAFSRQLSSMSSLNLNLLSQHSQVAETNELKEVGISYQRSLSKKSDFEISVSNARQDSSNVSNEYDQVVMGLLYTQSFH